MQIKTNEIPLFVTKTVLQVQNYFLMVFTQYIKQRDGMAEKK